MTLTITTEQVYLSIIAILMVVQIFQWRAIYKLKYQVEQIWTQIAILVTTISQQIEDLKKKTYGGK